ncbi:signal peptidase I [Streptomyces sp. TP-A0874]|uniref:signal peptidase I n=1 Tax=Streptomyces sp. TP-A0874 TaxID=549819 RepID=UPI000852AA63|nr:signal peptidase I [Streptomyces sp. TP-A0874]
MSGAGRGNGGRLGNLLSGWAVGIGSLLFLGGFVYGAVLYQPYTVPTDSMAPTIGVGDRVLAQRVDGGAVHRGDVVVFSNPLWGDLPMVKRVVGTDGDRITCCDEQGRLRVNGKAIDEPYVSEGSGSAPTLFSATVPKDHLFLLGDHRDASLDSREHLDDGEQGSVPRSAVDGRVEARAWPLEGLGMLPRATSFDTLSGGSSESGPLPMLAVAVLLGALLIFGGASYGSLANRLGPARRAGKAGG